MDVDNFRILMLDTFFVHGIIIIYIVHIVHIVHIIEIENFC